MSDALRDFEWRVASGYRWLTAVPTDGPTPFLVEEEGASHRSYNPLDRTHATLFRTFADVEPSPDGVLGFAREYGSLGPPVSTMSKSAAGAFVPDGELLWGAKRSWEHHIGTMRVAVRILDALTDRNTRALRDFVAKHEDLLKLFPLTAGAHHDDIRQQATHILTIFVQHEVSETVGPQLIHEPAMDRVRLVFAPRGLIGALWLQMAFALTEQKQYPQCKFCGRPFEVAKGPTGFRKSRDFCEGSACKSADYRRRKGEAIRLLRRGIKPAVVAQRTDTNVLTIKKWRTTLTAAPVPTPTRHARKTR
jgi:hypothetical protein